LLPHQLNFYLKNSDFNQESHSPVLVKRQHIEVGNVVSLCVFLTSVAFLRVNKVTNIFGYKLTLKGTEPSTNLNRKMILLHKTGILNISLSWWGL